mgnify:CR=1 FL=1
MTIIKIIEGDLLEASEKYIAQQTNCLTCHSHGLSKNIARKFSHGNIYGTRKPLTRNICIETDRDVPGTIQILKGHPNIICIFGQWAPGKSNGVWVNRYPLYQNIKETKQLRLIWFQNAIKEIENKVEEEMVGIPYKMGCGLAGGNWNEYEQILDNSIANFVIYKHIHLK